MWNNLKIFEHHISIVGASAADIENLPSTGKHWWLFVQIVNWLSIYFNSIGCSWTSNAPVFPEVCVPQLRKKLHLGLGDCTCPPALTFGQMPKDSLYYPVGDGILQQTKLVTNWLWCVNVLLRSSQFAFPCRNPRWAMLEDLAQYLFCIL